MKYTVIYEHTPSGYSVYVPDLPGCISVGGTLAEARAGIEEAIAFHIEGMRKDGLAIPEPSVSEIIEVAV